MGTKKTPPKETKGVKKAKAKSAEETLFVHNGMFQHVIAGRVLSKEAVTVLTRKLN